MTGKIPRFASTVCFFVFFVASSGAQPGVCPVSKSINPASSSQTLNVPAYRSYRPLVAGDYVVIEYNASQDSQDRFRGMTSWTDYNRGFDYRGLNKQTHIIGPNGSFLPIVYSKEKIAVRVCGLHFTDVLTVTTSPNSVPEGGADVRGAAPVTPPASLSSSLDMLQSGTATGGATTQPGLGLGAPAQLPSLAISGISLGSLTEDQTPGKYPTYTPAAVTASGRQVALLLFSVALNAKELTRLIGRTEGESYPAVKLENGVMAAPGSVRGVGFILKKVAGYVEADDTDPSNSAAFDRDMTDIQNINAQITTLAGALSSQAFASNTIALLNNYSTLAGVLNLADLARYPHCQGIPPALQPGQLSADDLKKLTKSELGALTLSQVKGLSESQIKDIEDKALQADIRSIQAALKVLTDTNPANDVPLCSAFEKQKIADFWNSYNEQVKELVHEVASDTANPDREADLRCKSAGASVYLQDPYKPNLDQNAKDEFLAFTGCRLYELHEKLDGLRQELRGIDEETTGLYDLMNEWYFRSSVEQTDLLPPLTSNAFVRISIVVQRGYTPFTLANAGGTFTATATTNVPATSSPGTTSTPPHAVKTILVEVHRLANFNLAGGAMFIHIPTASYAVQASPTPAVQTGSGATATYSGTCGGQTVLSPRPPARLKWRVLRLRDTNAADAVAIGSDGGPGLVSLGATTTFPAAADSRITEKPAAFGAIRHFGLHAGKLHGRR